MLSKLGCRGSNDRHFAEGAGRAREHMRPRSMWKEAPMNPRRVTYEDRSASKRIRWWSLLDRQSEPFRSAAEHSIVTTLNRHIRSDDTPNQGFDPR